MAKAPVPGQAKTRLGARLGHEVAAELAAASLLDTLDACEQVFGELHLALAGNLTGATRADELRGRAQAWTVHRQRGNGFAARLVNAHADASRHGRPVIQIGMDTPHVTATDLEAVAHAVQATDAVLGPAEDGGWWVLAVRDPRFAAPLRTVRMSTGRTCADTHGALASAGATVQVASTLRDVDTVEDAAHVAARAPGTRFAQVWSGVPLAAMS